MTSLNVDKDFWDSMKPRWQEPPVAELGRHRSTLKSIDEALRHAEGQALTAELNGKKRVLAARIGALEQMLEEADGKEKEKEARLRYSATIHEYWAPDRTIQQVIGEPSEEKVFSEKAWEEVRKTFVDEIGVKAYKSRLDLEEAREREAMRKRDLMETEARHKKEKEANMKSVFEVFVVDRTQSNIDPIGAVQSFTVVADSPEGARTIALLTVGVQVADLSNFHVHAREICQFSPAPVAKPGLPDPK